MVFLFILETVGFELSHYQVIQTGNNTGEFVWAAINLRNVQHMDLVDLSSIHISLVPFSYVAIHLAPNIYNLLIHILYNSKDL